MIDLLIEMYTVDGSLLVIGMMLFVAILLGGMLVLTNISRLTFIAATFSTMVFLVFVEMMRFRLLVEIGNPPTLRPIVLVTTLGLIYGLGLVAGVLIVHMTRRPYQKERQRLQSLARSNGISKTMLEIVEELS